MPEVHRENFFIELLKFAFLALIIVVPIRLFIAQPFIVSGESMVPTFQNGQYLIIDELSYRFHEPARGDVIVFRYPRDPSQFFIKRIIGLPGEVVHLTDTGVSITEKDGSTIALPESYVAHVGNGGTRDYPLPDGQYFVMGDNRPESSDSRAWGYLPKKDIVGHVLVRLFPLGSIAFLPGNTAELH